MSAVFYHQFVLIWVLDICQLALALHGSAVSSKYISHDGIQCVCSFEIAVALSSPVLHLVPTTRYPCIQICLQVDCWFLQCRLLLHRKSYYQCRVIPMCLNLWRRRRLAHSFPYQNRHSRTKVRWYLPTVMGLSFLHILDICHCCVSGSLSVMYFTVPSGYLSACKKAADTSLMAILLVSLSALKVDILMLLNFAT